VTIETGTAKIQNASFKIVHVIELEQYAPILGEIKRILVEDVTDQADSYPYLNHEIQQVESVLQRLTPRRKKRAIDALGTVWKWVAGTPDSEDFKIISDQMNKVLENNNRQVVINRLIEEKLNELINKTNTVTNAVKSYDQIQKDVSNLLEMKINVVKEELINVDYAVQWSKAGVINSFILSDLEMKITKDFFEKQNMPYVNLIEAIEYGEVKVASNGLTLIYIINLPKTNDENCKQLIVKAVKKGNSIVKIPNPNVITCKNSIFEMISDCKNFNDVSICKEQNFRNITNSKCLPNLLKGQPASCTKTNSQHIPLVEEIGPGILLLNAYNGSLKIDEKLMKMQGTFLIKFHDVVIETDKRTYENNQISIANPLPAIIQPGNLTANFEEILSLKMLKELHGINTKEIETLQIKYRTGFFSITGIGLLILALLAGKIFFQKFYKSLKVSTDNINEKNNVKLEQIEIIAERNEDTAL